MYLNITERLRYLSLIFMIMGAKTASADRYEPLNIPLKMARVSEAPSRSVWTSKRRGESGQGRASHITGIVEAPHHQLWIGTYAGLLRFDGVEMHEMSARSSLAPYPPISTSSITAIAMDSDGHDLYLALQGRGIWRFSPRGEQGVIKPVGLKSLHRATTFHLQPLDEALIAATSRGLALLRDTSHSSRGPLQSTSQGHLDHQARWDLITDEAHHQLSVRALRGQSGHWEIFTCGRQGVSYLTIKTRESADVKSAVLTRGPELIFHHPDPSQACRGVVVAPSESYRAQPNKEREADEVSFVLYERDLFLLKRESAGERSKQNFTAERVKLDELKTHEALWRQRPYIDPQGMLWVATRDLVLNLGTWREVSAKVRRGERVVPQERLKIRDAHVYWRDQAEHAPLWIGSLGDGLHQAQPLLGQSLRPSGLEQTSGAGPITATGDRFWWVESCNQLLTSRRDRARTPSLYASLGPTHLVSLPQLRDGACVDAMSEAQRRSGSALFLARRSEVLSLRAEERSGESRVSLKERWSIDCDQPDCRITFLTPSKSLSDAIQSSAPQDKEQKSTEVETQDTQDSLGADLLRTHLIAGTQDGRILSLTSGEAPLVLVNLNDDLSGSISAVKAIRFDPRTRSTLIAHHEGVLVISSDLKQLAQAHQTPRIFNITHYEGAQTSIGPVRDLVYDRERSLWWVASYGGGGGWLTWDEDHTPRARGVFATKTLDHFISGVVTPPLSPSPVESVDSPDSSLSVSQSSVLMLGNKGATLLKLDQGGAQRVGHAENLPIGEANGWLSPNHAQIGELLVTATTQGAVLLNLQQLRFQPPVPPPQITSLSYAKGGLGCDHPDHTLKTDRLIDDQWLSLPQETSDLCLSIASPMGVNAPFTTAQYRLTPDHLEEGAIPWVSLHTHRIRLSHLKSQRYILELRGVDDGSTPGASKTLKFEIKQPFVRRYATLSWCVLLGLGAIGFLLAWVIIKRARLSSRSAHAEMRHYWQVFESAEHGLLIYDQTGRCVEHNPRALQVFGVSADLLFQLSPSELGLGTPHLLDLEAREYHHMPMLCQRPQGEPFPARVSYHIHTSLHGDQGVLVSIMDLSTLVRAQDERLSAQRALSQSRRLESLGRLAGWVTHEVNNIFGVIEGFLESVREEMDQAELSHPNHYADLLAYLDRGQQRLQLLMGLDYRRPLEPELEAGNDGSLKPHLIQVEELFDTELELLSWLFSDQQSLEWIGDLTTQNLDSTKRRTASDQTQHTSRDEAPSSRLIDKSAFDLLIIRLMLCLTESEPHRERFQLQVEDLESRLQVSLKLPKDVLAQLSSREADLVQSPDAWCPVFLPDAPVDPIWTCLLEDVVRFRCEFTLIDGHLKVSFPLRSALSSNEVDPSTLFTAQETPQSSEDQTSVKTSTKTSVTGKRILLVDDNHDLVKLLSARLTRVGFEVITLYDSREAARYLRRPDLSIDLLVTDVLMPHLNGRQLANLCHELSPSTPVLFISAYTDDVLSPQGEFRLEYNERLLRKPFTPRQLNATAIEMLR